MKIENEVKERMKVARQKGSRRWRMEPKAVGQRGSKQSRLTWRCDRDEEQKKSNMWACAHQCKDPLVL